MVRYLGFSLLGILLAAPVLMAFDDPKPAAWEIVTSKEGDFTVDMPIKPDLTENKTRRIAGYTVKSLMLGAKTDDGVYLALRLDMPGALPRGSEEKVLDATRDLFAEEWNGKVLTEKKVLARGNTGRDFTVRGNPDNRGEATIRMREYLVGRSIFVVAVLSPPKKALPEDAGRFLGSLALGAEKIRATGTPEPEPKGTEVKEWGLAIDPDGDCKFTPAEGKKLALEIPGAMHDLGGPLHKVNAPRLMREVEGDFVISVKVCGEYNPGPKSTNPRSVPYIAAGILVWSDSDNFIRLERAAMLRGGRVVPHVAFLEQEGGYGGAVHNESSRAGDYYLRLERKGRAELAAQLSADGKTWKQLKPIDTVWPGKLKVGLTGVSTSSEPFTVNFEEFELKGKVATGDKP